MQTRLSELCRRALEQLQSLAQLVDRSILRQSLSDSFDPSLFSLHQASFEALRWFLLLTRIEGIRGTVRPQHTPCPYLMGATNDVLR